MLYIMSKKGELDVKSSDLNVCLSRQLIFVEFKSLFISEWKSLNFHFLVIGSSTSLRGRFVIGWSIGWLIGRLFG